MVSFLLKNARFYPLLVHSKCENVFLALRPQILYAESLDNELIIRVKVFFPNVYLY